MSSPGPPPTPRHTGLSKSRIAAFEQCARRLWLMTHRPELAAVSDTRQALFAAGDAVGAMACEVAGPGVMVEAEPDLQAALETTRALLAAGERRPIFEATFEHDDVLIRADILEPDAEDAGAWRLAEVKSSASAKPHHTGDLATQVWVAEQAGVRISRAALRHIDNRFTLEREGDYRGLFADEDLTEAAREVAKGRGELVAAARKTLAGAEPAIKPGDHCTRPWSCDFAAHCAAGHGASGLAAGPDWPVTVLPDGAGKRFLARGIEDLFEVDPAELKGAALRVHQATTGGAPVHDAAGARAVIDGWDYPRAWLDFETIAFAVPRWVGTRPYQAVPFQFSVHVETGTGTVDHHAFLSLDGSDPRRACAEALVRFVPPSGAIVAWSMGFERARLIELAADFPDLAPQLKAMAARLVDLWPVARNHWCHRDQRGSWSIKAVLPTLAPELDYSSLDVRDGTGAQAAYIEAIDPATTVERRGEIEAGLRAYCERDTWAMVVIAERLRGLSSPPLIPASAGMSG